MWRISDLVECLIFVALGLMLAYTAFVTVRFFRSYFLACRDFSSLVPDFTPVSQSRKNLFAELNRGVGTLRSIVSAAPFLGLAGACYGILLAMLRSIAWSGFFPTVALEIPTALVATGAGILVALAAAISYNALRMRLEKLESSRPTALLAATTRCYGLAQTLPLRRRFSGFPAFALIGAPVLALLIPMFALMMQRQTSVGLPVHLLRMGVTDHDSASIIISVIGPSASGQSAAYLNSREIPWSELGNALQGQLKVRPRWSVYVAGEDRVAWRDVLNAIDTARGLDAKVVLLTTAPTIESSHSRGKTKTRVSAR